MVEFDLFHLFRQLLVLVCVAYGIVRLTVALGAFVGVLATEDNRYAAQLQRYAVVQLLRIRIRRFGWDILQIVVLVLALGYVIAQHSEAGV